MVNADRFRKTARELRQIAEEAANEVERKQFLWLAKIYDELVTEAIAAENPGDERKRNSPERNRPKNDQRCED
jgi:hypothetical protein